MLLDPSTLFQRRWLWAGLGGLLLSTAFPKFNLAGFAWIAPAIILFAAIGVSPRRCFRLGYLAGLLFWLTSLYWLLFMPFPLGAIVGWLALCAYLALYMAVWVWACWALFDALPHGRLSGTKSNALLKVVESPLVWRWFWGAGCAVVWVALEMIRARLLTGFPWNLLAVSQHRILVLLQLSSITGPYGLSFVMIWFAVGLGCAAAKLAIGSRLRADAGTRVQPILPRPLSFLNVWIGDLLLPGLALAGLVGFGLVRIKGESPAPREISIALVQPSVPQTLIWDPKENTNRFRQLIELSQTALAAKPDLLLWPEGAVPSLLRYEEEVYRAVTGLARTNHTWIILGADDAELRKKADGSEEADYFNASFLVSPSGEIAARYQKQHLVMFGEYIPFGNWLPFLKVLAPVGDGFAAGKEPVQFRMSSLGATASVLICFEDVIPQLARRHAQSDTSFLIDLTNDGWFSESAAQWQHAANSVFRAIENGLPLVRCANNGITCWIDSLGQMHSVNFADGQSVYGAGVKFARLPLIATPRAATFYSDHGDWFGWSCVGLAFAIAGFCRLRPFAFASASREGKSGQ